MVVAKPGALADRLEASSWQIALPGVTLDHAQAAVDGFLATEEVLIERMMKKGLRTLDCRAAVLALSANLDDSARTEGTNAGPCAILTVVVRHDTPSIRPDDVLAGLRSSGGLKVEQTPIATRLAQGPLNADEGTVGDPLAFDRDAS